MRLSEDVGHTARLSVIPKTCYIHPECDSLKMSATQRDCQPFQKHVTYILNAVIWRCRPHIAIISHSKNMLHTSWMQLSEDVGHTARLSAIPKTCYIHPECGYLKMSDTQRDYHPFQKHVTYILNVVLWRAQFRARGEAPQNVKQNRKSVHDLHGTLTCNSNTFRCPRPAKCYSLS